MDGGETRVDVLVAGAGLAGLAAAATAAERPGLRVAVLDGRAPGGRARSELRDGFVLNQGPHAVYLHGPGAAVLGGLGVALPGRSPSLRLRGVRGGALVPFPGMPGSFVRRGGLPRGARAALVRALVAALRADASQRAPPRAAGWIRGLALPADAASAVATLLRVASYAPDLEELSADAAVRQLQLAARGVRYLHGGWQRLVDGLVDTAAARGVQVVPGDRVTSLLPVAGGAGGWTARSAAGRSWSARSVVLAAGGPAAARALVPQLAVPEGAVDATVACLDLGLRRRPPVRVAFGLDAPLYLSTHSPSARLAPPGAALVHVLRYGARSSAEDRAELRELARLAGVAPGDVVVERFLHRMVVAHALPRPGAGLAGRQPVAVAGRAGLFLAGDWVGPRGMLADAALASGADAGRAAAAAAAADRAPVAEPAGHDRRAG